MLGITTDSFAGYGIDRAFALAKKAGLDGIEVSIQHGYFDTYDADYLKELSKRHDLPIFALSAPVNMSSDKAEKVVKIAEDLGIDLVNLTPPDIFDFDYKKWVKNDLENLRKKKKIHIAIVNPPIKTMLGILPKYAFNDIYQLKEVLDLCFDTSNTVGRSEPLLDIYNLLKKSIRCIHLANSKHEKDHTLVTNGNIPLESFLTRLARDEFEGNLIFKIDPKALEVGKEDKLIENLQESKKFVEKFLKVGGSDEVEEKEDSKEDSKEDEEKGKEEEEDL